MLSSFFGEKMKFSLIMENWRKFLAEEKTTSEQLKPRRGADEVAVDSSGKKIYRTGWAFTDKDPSAPEVYNFKRNPTPEEDYFAWASKQKLSQDQIDYMLGRGRSAPEDLAKDVSKLLQVDGIDVNIQNQHDETALIVSLA